MVWKLKSGSKENLDLGLRRRRSSKQPYGITSIGENQRLEPSGRGFSRGKARARERQLSESQALQFVQGCGDGEWFKGFLLLYTFTLRHIFL